MEGLNFNSPALQSKLLYLRGLLQTGETQLNTLQNARKTAADSELPLVYVLACNALGDCYADGSYNAMKYYAEACEATQKLSMDVLKQYQQDFIARNTLLKLFERILSAKKDKPVFGENVLDIIYYKDLFADMLSDNAFHMSAREIYFSTLPRDIKNRNDVFKYISDDPQKSLGLIANYLAAEAYAVRCEIITDDEDEEFIVVASNNEDLNRQSDTLLLRRIKAHGGDVLESIYTQG